LRARELLREPDARFASAGSCRLRSRLPGRLHAV